MFCYDAGMRDLVILFLHVIATLLRLLRPGGLRSVVAESVLVKQQLLILNRSRQRSPNLRTADGQPCFDSLRQRGLQGLQSVAVFQIKDRFSLAVERKNP